MTTDLPHVAPLLRNVTLASGVHCDVALSADTVTEVLPAGTAAAAPGEMDLSGFLLLNAPADPHAHLDKALSWDAIKPPMGDLESAIAAWREYSYTMSEEDIARRALAAALRLLQQGTTAVRSHVDVLFGEDPYRGIRALVSVREQLRGLMTLEIAALPHWEIPDETIEEALRLGADLVGGVPHLAPDPTAEVHRLLTIAEKHHVGVDLHTDENLYGDPTLGTYAQLIRDWQRSGRTFTAGHAVRLGTLPADERDRIIAETQASGIGIVSLPITNLYLQGWEEPVSTPRGLTALRQLIDTGALVSAGGDNVRDPFNPVGRSDAFETASLLVAAGHLTVDEAYDLVSQGSRKVMGLVAATQPSTLEITAGQPAELLAVKASNLAQAVGEAPADRCVFHRGVLVSQTTTSTRTAPPLNTFHVQPDSTRTAI